METVYKIILKLHRCLATQAAVKTKPVEGSSENVSARESLSFTMNIFRSQLQLDQVFPFPEPLTEEQTDTVKMLIDPIEKFYEVKISSNNDVYQINARDHK